MSSEGEEIYGVAENAAQRAAIRQSALKSVGGSSSKAACRQSTLINNLDALEMSDADRSVGSSADSKRRSVDPLSAHINYRVSATPAPGPVPAVYVQNHEDEEDENAKDPAAEDDPPSPSQDPSQTHFLSRIGFRRRAPSLHDAVSEHSYDTSASSIADVRQSLESSRSTLLTSSSSTGQAPPHGARPVKMKSKAKTSKKFSKLVLGQTLTTEAGTFASLASANKMEEVSANEPFGAIWTLEFSKDGKYLASGGQSCVVMVWKVLDKPKDGDGETIESIHVFEDAPMRQYEGHQADILDISWSKNNFLLSSSMDKTVRLWHVTREECLCVFRHLDFVTGIAFHPRDDRYFLSGSLDCKLRLWSIQDKKVTFWSEVPGDNMLTAVGFTLDGKIACAGSHSGQVFFYETEGLKYHTQISLKQRAAKKGRKITGIEAMPGMPPGEEKILVTSNDSRVRLINMKDKSLMYKYKGPDNASMQIKATFSDDGRYLICGSEDANVYLWGTEQASFSPFHYLQDSRFKAAAALGHFGEQMMQTAMNAHQDTAGSNEDQQGSKLISWLKRGERRAQQKLRSRSEHFEAHQHVVTCTAFAPTRTRQQLARRGCDIIYDNTPIYTPAHVDRKSEEGSLQPAPSFSASMSRLPSKFEEAGPEARDTYNFEDGQILVSADFHGCIKVWRMDSGVYSSKRNSVDEISLGSKSAVLPMTTTRAGEADPTPSESTLKHRRRPFGSLFPSRHA